MAQTTTILVRIDEDVKRDAEVMLDKLGMNFSTAINMFFRKLIMDEAFPLRPNIKATSKNRKFCSLHFVNARYLSVFL